MPTQIKLTVILLLGFLSSFTTTNTFIGTYGESASDPSQIKLSVNADNTFACKDLSMASKV